MEYDNNYLLIGIEPSLQKNEQTHGDWKDEIKSTLSEIFGEDNITMSWYEECL